MSEQVQRSTLDKLFKITERGSSVSRELFAGATTFLCVSYVLAVNPAILGAAGMDIGAVFTATAVSAIIMTLLLALYSNMPFAGLSGMGINAFFAYTIVVQMGHSFAFALTAQLVAGLVFLLIAVTPLKEYLFNAIPHTIKLAVTAGIGLFIALIGLSSAGLVVSNPATLISIGDLQSPSSLSSHFGSDFNRRFYGSQCVKVDIFLSRYHCCGCWASSVGSLKLPVDEIFLMPPSLAADLVPL